MKAREFETNNGIEIDILKNGKWKLFKFISYDNPHWAAEYARVDYKLTQKGYNIKSE